MGYAVARVKAVAEKFRSLPPAPEDENREINKQETVRMLKAEIEGLVARGYSLDQVAELLRNEGLDFATPALRTYLTRIRKAKSAKKGRKETDAGEPQNTEATSELIQKPQTTVRGKKSNPAKATFAVKPDTQDI